jgi:hypothetical protein
VSGLPRKAKPSKDGGAKSERLKPTCLFAGQDRPTAERQTRGNPVTQSHGSNAELSQDRQTADKSKTAKSFGPFFDVKNPRKIGCEPLIRHRRGRPRHGPGYGISARDGADDDRNMAQLPLRIDFFESRSLFTDGDRPTAVTAGGDATPNRATRRRDSTPAHPPDRPSAGPHGSNDAR